MSSVFLVLGLAAVGIFVLWSANTGTWYWGRRGPNKSWPFTRLQQRIIGWSWALALLLMSATLGIRAIFPNVISDAQWNHISIFLVVSAMDIMWITGLIDPRTKSLAASSRTARFVISVNWILATAMLCVGMINLIVVFRT